MTTQRLQVPRYVATALMFHACLLLAMPAQAANFGQPTLIPLPGVKRVVVVDLTGDGRNDILGKTQVDVRDVFGDRTRTETLTVLAGRGDGSFSAPREVWSKSSQAPSGTSDYDLGCDDPVVGDFNGDGRLDIAMSTGESVFTVWLARPDGSFQMVNSGVSGDRRSSTGSCKNFVAEVNNDGILDIVTNDGALYLGRGDGSFRGSAVPLNASLYQEIVAVGDFDRDGVHDLIVATDLPSLQFWRGRGNGTFVAPVGSATGFPQYVNRTATARTVSIGDFNGDGFLDVLVTGESITINLGRGNGTFASHIGPADSSESNTFHNSYGIAVADFSLDGKSDAIVASEKAVIYGFLGGVDPRQSHVEGLFAWVPSGVLLYGQALATAVGDVNGDGRLDLVTAQTGFTGGGLRSDRIEVYLNAMTVSRNASDCLFSWAERVYPTLFTPAGAPSFTTAPYFYRYYPQTRAYLGSSGSDNHVYYLGPATNNVILDVGPLGTWLATAGCE